MNADHKNRVLDVIELNAFYGKTRVVFDLSLTVAVGETVALLGRNGAGKTSALHAIAGIVSMRCTALQLEGNEIAHLPAFKRVREGLALVPSGSRAFPNLTVDENLNMVNRRGGDRNGWTVDDVYDAFPALRELKRSMARSLSGGERQMLAVARAIVARPRVLMMDEPSEGLAPMIVSNIPQMLQDLNENGVAVLLAEQNHRLALNAARHAYFLENGRIAWHGDAREAAQPEVLGRYLGIGPSTQTLPNARA